MQFFFSFLPLPTLWSTYLRYLGRVGYIPIFLTDGRIERCGPWRSAGPDTMGRTEVPAVKEIPQGNTAEWAKIPADRYRHLLH